MAGHIRRRLPLTPYGTNPGQLPSSHQESVDESVSNLFVVTDGVGDVPEGKPAVQFLSRQPKHDPAQADAEYIPLDKSQYAAVISQIGPFIRRLPFGAKASEEAKARAREFGILLGEGETFVRPHKKTIYRQGSTGLC